MSETDKLARDIRFFLIAVLVILTIRGVFDLGKDSTDPADGRSGLALFTDAQTGCEYLSGGVGGITPRVDRDGKQICTN